MAPAPLPAVACFLGRRPYGPMHALQERLLEHRIAGELGNVVLLLEHEPVVTLGRSAKREHLLFDEEGLRAFGVELFATGRGGDVTLHAAGPRVCYPLLELRAHR